MRCESALIRLDELRTGELDRSEVEAVRRHLQHCSYCDGVYHRIADIASNARSLHGECPCSCADALEQRLLDRVATTRVDGAELWVAFSERGLSEVVTAAGRSFESFVGSHWKRFGKELRRGPLPVELEEQLADAWAGRGVAEPRVDLAPLPEFEREVLATLPRIPSGEVRSYAWVAREVGRPTAVRAVGNVCARNPVPLVVPCHRVVPASGGIGGYRLGEELKRELLDREGVDLERIALMTEARSKYVRAGEHWYCFPTCRWVKSLPPDQVRPVRDERAAAALGLEPCATCRPLVAA